MDNSVRGGKKKKRNAGNQAALPSSAGGSNIVSRQTTDPAPVSKSAPELPLPSKIQMAPRVHTEGGCNMIAQQQTTSTSSSSSNSQTLRLPAHYQDQNSNDLRMTWAASHRPQKCQLSTSLPDDAGFYVHCLRPTYLRKAGKFKAKAIHIQKTSKRDMPVPYVAPEPEYHKDMVELWKSLQEGVSDDKFWKSQWDKHAKFNKFTPVYSYWEKAIKAAKMFFTPGSKYNLKEFMDRYNYKPGNTYGCQKFVKDLRAAFECNVDVSFREHGSSFWYLDEIGIMFDSDMEILEERPTSEYPEERLFLFEDMKSRREQDEKDMANMKKKVGSMQKL